MAAFLFLEKRQNSESMASESPGFLGTSGEFRASVVREPFLSAK
jgi:hypothetical protein